ncbi:MAG: hypothetical protein M1827_006038 [Pycnora praestabilis]|nr:MAG: hypothetical protein M1827_006038 [Pycnora praestabilis]
MAIGRHRTQDEGRWLSSIMEPTDDEDPQAVPMEFEPPVHPMPCMQGAFEESMMEMTNDVEAQSSKVDSEKLDSATRRRILLEQEHSEDTHAARWRQKPGERFHPLYKLVAQIAFGVHLLHKRLAKSDEEVVKILQTHVTEVDEFLERTTEDFELAQNDVSERIKYLRLPLEHYEVFDAMLDDRAFRNSIIDGNEKIEHIVNRTRAAMSDALKDVQKGLEATQELARYLGSLEKIWQERTDELLNVYAAMIGNAEGWMNCCISLQKKGHKLGISLAQLQGIVAEMQRRAGIASRKNRFTSHPHVLRSQFSTSPGPSSPELQVSASKPLPLDPGLLRSPTQPAPVNQYYQEASWQPSRETQQPIQQEYPSRPSSGQRRPESKQDRPSSRQDRPNSRQNRPSSRQEGVTPKTSSSNLARTEALHSSRKNPTKQPERNAPTAFPPIRKPASPVTENGYHQEDQNPQTQDARNFKSTENQRQDLQESAIPKNTQANYFPTQMLYTHSSKDSTRQKKSTSELNSAQSTSETTKNESKTHALARHFSLRSKLSKITPTTTHEVPERPQTSQSHSSTGRFQILHSEHPPTQGPVIIEPPRTPPPRPTTSVSSKSSSSRTSSITRRLSLLNPRAKTKLPLRDLDSTYGSGSTVSPQQRSPPPQSRTNSASKQPQATNGNDNENRNMQGTGANTSRGPTMRSIITRPLSAFNASNPHPSPCRPSTPEDDQEDNEIPSFPLPPSQNDNSNAFAATTDNVNDDADYHNTSSVPKRPITAYHLDGPSMSAFSKDSSFTTLPSSLTALPPHPQSSSSSGGAYSVNIQGGRGNGGNNTGAGPGSGAGQVRKKQSMGDGIRHFWDLHSGKGLSEAWEQGKWGR